MLNAPCDYKRFLSYEVKPPSETFESPLMLNKGHLNLIQNSQISKIS